MTTSVENALLSIDNIHSFKSVLNYTKTLWPTKELHNNKSSNFRVWLLHMCMFYVWECWDSYVRHKDTLAIIVLKFSGTGFCSFASCCKYTC